MVTSVRQLLLVLTFLVGILAGLYLAAAVREGHAQSPEVAAAIHEAATAYGVSEAWMRRIAACESRFSAGATSWGGHQGLYQYAPRTWAWMSRRAGYAGASPYDPRAAAMVTGYALSRGLASHWACR